MGYIYIHGLGQTPSSWDETLSYLDGYIQVNCPDLFALCKVQKISYQHLYDGFKEYCDEFSGPLNLCGISLGAILALNYAMDHPKKVKSLVLIAPQYKMPRILMKFQNMLFNLIPESSFKTFGMKKKDVIQLTNSMLKLNFSDNLNNVSCPTLIVCGKRDYANRKAAKNLANNILKVTEVTFHLMGNVGHEVNVEAPKALATILNAFHIRRKGEN